jgi:uncharacterized protein (DUF427 family)
MSIRIQEAKTGAVLAEGEPGSEDVLRYEGNWYFAPVAVRRDVLRVTERTYTCPAKGTCFWVDHVNPDGTTTRDVAWIYENPKPGHERIRGRYGFYAGTRGATREA